ncbi:MAG: tRNA1(Val) (adenine(37)-N6)-methyltransferase [Clostridiales bacterium]|nr:tRNA1(Val) (adenine(37)-N6)-methyltransferase [Clostridiales bacterium]
MEQFGVEIYPDERVDDLQCRGYKLIQKKKGFSFGSDAVLLAAFAEVRRGDQILDLGTGSGIIPVLLAAKTKAAMIKGIEIQPEIAGMANRSIVMNKLENKVEIVCGDLRDYNNLKVGWYDLVVTNPPYNKTGGSIINNSGPVAISRHEVTCTLNDVVTSAARALRPDGRFAVVYRPERLVDLVWIMRNVGIEPKCLRFVHSSIYKKAHLVLINGTKGGKPELKMLPPLYIYDEVGLYTEEVRRIYGDDCRKALSGSDTDRES